MNKKRKDLKPEDLKRPETTLSRSCRYTYLSLDRETLYRVEGLKGGPKLGPYLLPRVDVESICKGFQHDRRTEKTIFPFPFKLNGI